MTPRILLVHTYDPEFLGHLYASEPGLGDLESHQQRERVLSTGFCLADAYSHNLRAQGFDARDVIVNADRVQSRWAREHRLVLTGNIHDQRRQVIAAQVYDFRPDVLYVFEWCPLGDAFLGEIKQRVRLVVGQIGSPLRDERTYAAYDLVISSWPPMVDNFRRDGIEAVYLKLGFDERVLERIHDLPPQYDVTFVGGLAPSHPDRVQWLERLLTELDIDIFGYGVESTSSNSPIRAHHHGPAWGWTMYEVLCRSRITLNRQARIDVRGTAATNVAANMRLYEATGVGTCLVTEAKDNLIDMFEPGREVITYENEVDCVGKVRSGLASEQERAAVARAGRQRTLSEHSYARRMQELADHLDRYL